MKAAWRRTAARTGTAEPPASKVVPHNIVNALGNRYLPISKQGGTSAPVPPGSKEVIPLLNCVNYEKPASASAADFQKSPRRFFAGRFFSYSARVLQRECPFRRVFCVPPLYGRGNTNDYLFGLDALSSKFPIVFSGVLCYNNTKWFSAPPGPPGRAPLKKDVFPHDYRLSAEKRDHFRIQQHRQIPQAG